MLTSQNHYLKMLKKSELDIEDKDVKDLISFLMSCAKQQIKTDYNISLDSISDIQINKVQELIDSLQNNDNLVLDELNETLRVIYTTIPRKMSDTRNFFFNKNTFTSQHIIDLLQNEQKKLDTLKSQVKLNNQQKTIEKITLKDLGFDCMLASDEDRKFIADNTDFRVKTTEYLK